MGGSTLMSLSCTLDSLGIGKTGCDQSTVQQAKQLICLPLSFSTFPLFTDFPNHPRIFLAPLRMTRANDNSCTTILFPSDLHTTVIFTPHPQVLELGAGRTVSCMKFSPTVSGGETVSSKTGTAFSFTVPSRMLCRTCLPHGGSCLRAG